MASGSWDSGSDLQRALLGFLFDSLLRQGVNEVDTSGMVPMLIRDMGTIALTFGWDIGVELLGYCLGCWGKPTPWDVPSTFSSGRSCCSLHAQPRGAGHDGAGTSGTHIGDTDDDSKESTEDEEGEYESSDE
uniref:Uncharacterized protein n=1 Tax=Lactuca sativa TaxID=4236 RepID=A0A9R1VP62_LACSA|nr:hypothetical protein LSAT_V11C500281930 [Lactuca sativa]